MRIFARCESHALHGFSLITRFNPISMTSLKIMANYANRHSALFCALCWWEKSEAKGENRWSLGLANVCFMLSCFMLCFIMLRCVMCMCFALICSDPVMDCSLLEKRESKECREIFGANAQACFGNIGAIKVNQTTRVENIDSEHK